MLSVTTIVRTFTRTGGVGHLLGISTSVLGKRFLQHLTTDCLVVRLRVTSLSSFPRDTHLVVDGEFLLFQMLCLRAQDFPSRASISSAVKAPVASSSSLRSDLRRCFSICLGVKTSPLPSLPAPATKFLGGV